MRLLRFFSTVCSSRALPKYSMQAMSIDERICRGEDPGILTGVVFAIKVRRNSDAFDGVDGIIKFTCSG